MLVTRDDTQVQWLEYIVTEFNTIVANGEFFYSHKTLELLYNSAKL